MIAGSPTKTFGTTFGPEITGARFTHHNSHLYKNNGTGRDSYIYNNNGGFAIDHKVTPYPHPGSLY